MSTAVQGLASSSNGRAPKSLKGRFGMALKSLYNQGENRRLLEELDASREQLHTALLVSLWYSLPLSLLPVLLCLTSSLVLSFPPDTMHVFFVSIPIVLILWRLILSSFRERSAVDVEAVARMQRSVDLMRSEMQKAPDTSDTEPQPVEICPLTEDTRLRRVFDEMVSTIWDPERSTKPEIDEPDYGEGVPEPTVNEKRRAARAVRSSLRFEGFEKRSDMIPEAYETTLEWIWEQEPPIDRRRRRRRWSSFPDWLRDPAPENPMYWITGKPGSGKSTLMKYIQGHENFRRHLWEWASAAAPAAPAPESVVDVSYYAWSPGSDVQKSIDGLWRTILECALRHDPMLVDQIVPRRWVLMRCLPGFKPSGHPIEDWPSWELRESMSLLLKTPRLERKVLLLIDGLDEFSDAPRKLLANISEIATAWKGAIKICTASRPWSAFNDFFAASPQLAMHELSADSIRLFVNDKLAESRAFQERGQEAVALQTAVLERANGVFLWVSVVTHFLLERFEAGDTMKELEQAVRAMPEEMSGLYDGIWGRVSSRTRVQAQRFFALKEACPKREMHYLILWIIDEHPSEAKIQVHDLDRIRRTIVRRLHSRTYGLLEVTSNGTIEYLHRTAVEWTDDRGLRGSDAEPELNYSLMRAFGQLVLRSPVPDENFVKAGPDRDDWYPYLMFSLLFHVSKEASRRSAGDQDELATILNEMISTAGTWQSTALTEDESVREALVWSSWLEPGQDVRNLYVLMAALGMTMVFDRLSDTRWASVKTKGWEVLSSAVHLPDDHLLRVWWGVNERQYLDAGLLRAKEKLRLVQMLLNRRLVSVMDVRTWKNYQGATATAYFDEVLALLTQFCEVERSTEVRYVSTSSTISTRWRQKVKGIVRRESSAQ